MRRVAFGLCAGLTGVLCCALTNCSSPFGNFDPRWGVSSSPRLVGPGEPVPKGGGVYRIGSPYMAGGRMYVPREDPNYRAEGLASWYGDDFHGRETANGEIFDMYSISGAHPTLPLPSYVRVTNLGNRRSLIVRVNDRGPYHTDRIIDLSAKAARLLDFHGDGVARVRVEYVSRAPLEGSDDSVLLATLRQGQPAPAPSPILLASSFLPHFAGRASRLDVPLPLGRPYGLGQDRQASPEAPVSAAARPVVPAAFDARSSDDRLPATIADVPHKPSPVAAFAPPPSVMTGRGLY